MNRRQQKRRAERRAQHAALPADRPAIVLSRDTYTEVKTAHIVPRMYQRAWEVNGRVAVHAVEGTRSRLLTTKKAGTREYYYRRARPNEEKIDDVEASLAYMEGMAAEPLRELVAGAPITTERKGTVGQFFGVQMLRGPDFFSSRHEAVQQLLEAIAPEQIKPEVSARFETFEEAREFVAGVALGDTERFKSMLTRGAKVGVLLAHMRWQIIRFDSPVLAFSDQPVVLWPAEIRENVPFDRPRFGPLSALEVRVPLAPDAALLMTWLDRKEETETHLPPRTPRELNAFTRAQADEDWMHRPGSEPLFSEGVHRPLSRLLDADYDARYLARSERLAIARSWYEKSQQRTHVRNAQGVVM